MSASEFKGHEALIAELRAGTLDAPGQLHRRVLAGRPARQRRSWAEMSRRRKALWLVPLAATLAIGAALVDGAFNSGSKPQAQAAASEINLKHALAALRKQQVAQEKAFSRVLSGVQGSPVYGSAWSSRQAARADYYGYKDASTLVANRPATLTAGAATDSVNFGQERAVSIPTNRKVHADATLTVAVPNTDGLNSAVNDATQIVTRLGGYVQHRESQATRKGQGTATLSLRIPIGKVNLAIARLGRLGVVVSESVATEDLQKRFSKQVDTIGRLRRAITIYEQALQNTSLTYSQRVDLQIRLSNARYQLREARRSHNRTAAYAATSNVSLTLSVNKHAFVVPPTKRGHLGNLLHNAGHFLAYEGVIVLLVLIVGGPIVLLVALAWWLTRERRRRMEKALLASA